MKLGLFILFCSESSTIKVFDYETRELIGEYNGKDSIDAELNNLVIVEKSIIAKGNTIEIDVIKK